MIFTLQVGHLMVDIHALGGQLMVDIYAPGEPFDG